MPILKQRELLMGRWEDAYFLVLAVRVTDGEGCTSWKAGKNAGERRSQFELRLDYTRKDNIGVPSVSREIFQRRTMPLMNDDHVGRAGHAVSGLCAGRSRCGNSWDERKDEVVRVCHLNLSGASLVVHRRRASHRPAGCAHWTLDLAGNAADDDY